MDSMRDFADRGYKQPPVADTRGKWLDLVECLLLAVTCWALAVTMLICLLRGN